MSIENRRGVFYPALICAFALAAAVAISHPVLELATNDDWSYVWSARVLADTGHVVYNGWGAMMLGWQLYLGALFIKLFGFSFTAARISVLIVSIGTVVLIQRLFLRFGISQWNATIATLTIALSPLFLPLAYSFMSDVPSFFCLIVCFYSCVRAIQAGTDRAAAGWLVFAALSNVLGGTVRQVAWLGALVVVPCTTWYLRRRAGVILTGVVVWLMSAIAIVGCIHWFNHQPYSLREGLLSNPHTLVELVVTVKKSIKNSFAACLYVLPVLIGFLWKFPLGSERARKQSAIVGAFLVLITLFFIFHRGSSDWLAPFSGNIVTEKGLDNASGMAGNPPDILSFSVRLILSIVTFAAAISFLLLGWNSYSVENRASQSVSAFPWEALLTIFGPFTLVYVFLLVTRTDIFDRYLLPLIFVFLVILLRVYEEEVGARLPKISLFLVLLFGAFAVAGMHDLFAMGRARLTAADEILAAGVVRTEIQGGFEYDGWTQLESTGYMNNDRIRIPAGAFHPKNIPANVPAGCYFGFWVYTPSINPRYILSVDQSSCYSPSQFAPVSYNAWLSPHTRTIYIHKVP
ncbi:ArnT family glycosyltransferase [Tunturibacter empetritectus]|uniref:Glycosyltransferase RgtA/B/C/D-like domain-containing protein n=1 Tax=Tunturiibacter empetritectus TaxID=3069691 RepID=A0A7W8MSF2_9BACT|nr:glycosyltransferase family 39 protein [Edaphobacter lichenicola]MBB5318911.1 hypothetical protein [Edaphobacter lichenicola]